MALRYIIQIYNTNLVIDGFLFRGWAGAAAALTCVVGVLGGVQVC